MNTNGVDSHADIQETLDDVQDDLMLVNRALPTNPEATTLARRNFFSAADARDQRPKVTSRAHLIRDQDSRHMVQLARDRRAFLFFPSTNQLIVIPLKMQFTSSHTDNIVLVTLLLRTFSVHADDAGFSVSAAFISDLGYPMCTGDKIVSSLVGLIRYSHLVILSPFAGRLRLSSKKF